MLTHLITVVIITFNRKDDLRRTLERMLALPGVPGIIVVDNASTDTTRSMVRDEFPAVKLIALHRNLGAAARNIAVGQAHTPYIAFCDDDSWWADGSLQQAVRILDQYPRIAAVCARILLGPAEREDPVCKLMESSPLPSHNLPGPSLLGFIACAVVFRRDAYLQAGGYEAKFFVGGEEELLTLDLVSSGWRVVYVPSLTVHHYPSPQRDNSARQKIVIRNALWVAWLRLPLLSALSETWRLCRAAPNATVLRAALREALREALWVWRNRKVLPREVQMLRRQLKA